MLDKLKISVRLTIGFSLVLSLLCVIATLSAWQMGRLADNTNTYASSLVPSYEVEHDVSIGLGNIRRFELQHILSNSDSEMGNIEAKVSEFRDHIQGQLDRYARDVPTDEQNKRYLDAARAAASAYYGQWERVRTVSRMKAQYPSKIAEATQLSTGPSAKAYDDAHASVAAWWAYNVKLANDQSRAAESTYRLAKIVLASLVLTAIVLGGSAAVLITRSIVRQLGGEPDYAAGVADQISKGNLCVDVRLRAGDSTSLLAAIGAMRDNLDRIVGQVRSSADSIATGSAQIASGNADLSQRTEEQNNSLQQTAASLQQLSVAVNASADAAGHANEAAADASGAAANGGRLVGKVIATMSDIAAASRKIASIIGVIDDIAFQTNILALNAAVEAARAGEQGRGFAVVANEVRSLAGRSAEAAKEIKTLIGASVGAIDQGAVQVTEAGDSMTAIVSQVRRVSELVSEISRATVEQSAGIGQVGDSMRQLDGVTQQNAALVEESAAAAESLRYQAEKLAELVNVFQVAAAVESNGEAPPAE